MRQENFCHDILSSENVTKEIFHTNYLEWKITRTFVVFMLPLKIGTCVVTLKWSGGVVLK